MRDTQERDDWVSRRLHSLVGATSGTRGVAGVASDPARDEAPHQTRPSHGGGANETAGATRLQAAFDPGRPGLRALAAVAVVVVVVAGLLVWWNRPHTDPVAPGPAGSAGGGPVVEAGPVVVVAVAGRVKHPGLVRLTTGARVADAIAAAGGVLPGTDITGLNLARKVADGELITVGSPGGALAQGTGPAGKVNLNSATQAQLDGLPGVGPVLAQRIIAWREGRGGFRSVSDLRQVEGIGDAKFEQLKDLVTV